VNASSTQTLTNKTMTAAGGNAVEATSGPTSTQLAGMRNKIINGAMMIDQRNAGASVTASVTSAFTYTLDRWAYYAGQASKFSIQQSSTAPNGFKNSLLITSSSAYSPVAGDIFSILQPIEGLNVSDLGFGTASAATVTLSFWVRSSLTGTFGGSLLNSSGVRSYPFSYTINSANTFEYKTITVAGDTAGTWLTTNGVGLYVAFGLGTGSTYSGPANAWAGNQYWSPTGATSVVGTNGATFYITGVQLEKGATATPFENRLYGTELALCQRYWERIGYGFDIVIGGYQAAGGAIYASFSHAVPKRAYPTVTKVGTWTVSNAGQPTVANPTPWGFRAYISVVTSGTGYAHNDSSSLYITSDAEL
jgi:hypothetical protein